MLVSLLGTNALLIPVAFYLVLDSPWGGIGAALRIFALLGAVILAGTAPLSSSALASRRLLHPVNPSGSRRTASTCGR